MIMMGDERSTPPEKGMIIIVSLARRFIVFIEIHDCRQK